MDMRLFFPKELDSYLIGAGFDVIHKFGSFQEDAFQDNSEKQIYVLALNKGSDRKNKILPDIKHKTNQDYTDTK